MSVTKGTSEEEVTLRPIGQAIEEAQAKLARLGKGNPDVQEKINQLTGIHSLVKIVCGKTYGRVIGDFCK